MNESRGGAGGATGARVVLRSVSDVDRAALLDLRVAPHQACFVSDSAATLDEAAAMPEAYVRAVCVSEEAVGLVMYGLDREEKAPWIYRFLIDQRHQGRGLGGAALEATVHEVALVFPLRRAVFIGVRPENTDARMLYERHGFKPDGRTFGREIVLCRPLR